MSHRLLPILIAAALASALTLLVVASTGPHWEYINVDSALVRVDTRTGAVERFSAGDGWEHVGPRK